MLDVPFGLGYNTFVFLQEIFRTGKLNDLSNIEIVAIEQDRAVLSLTERVLQDEKFSFLRESLGFSSGDDFADSVDPISASRLRHFCQCLQDSSVYETRVGKTHLSITVQQGDMRTIVPMLADDGQHFDFIMHDPFSPNKMPELWTIDIL
ncbi:MnmC family methyltransferase, partial [Cutibacterium acnes]